MAIRIQKIISSQSDIEIVMIFSIFISSLMEGYW